MPPKRASKADWTVMVFLNAKNNLESFSFLNFDQMATVGSTDRVNVLVEFGRPQRNYVDLYGGWSKTLRYRVTKGMKPTEAKALDDLGAVNMGDGAALADFVTWCRDAYPAERYMLAIWDHGQGWRRRSALTVRGAGGHGPRPAPGWATPSARWSRCPTTSGSTARSATCPTTRTPATSSTTGRSRTRWPTSRPTGRST
jgi:hypothetical protein